MALTEILGESPAITTVRDQVTRLLRPPAGPVRRLPPVLLLGETGTGKGLLASAIHHQGPRASGPFVDVNCAAIPETMLEAELFGFERGAFTDARQAKPGLFQVANGGTIFLDEIGLLPLGLQAKLLRVVEERSVRRLGGTRNEPLDVWVMAATSEDLVAGVRARRFREDLYHRLAVVALRLPPLRERGGDVLTLAEHFLARVCHDYGLAPKTLGADARAALLAHRWPGNVRELANVMERAALLADARTLTAELLGLPPAAEPPPPAPAVTASGGEVPETEDSRERLLEALRATGWNISRASVRLGVPRNTLRYRLEKHGLGPEVEAAGRRRGGRPPSAPRREPAPDREPAPPLSPRPQWESRRITLLNARLVAEGDEAPASTMSRALEGIVEKVRSFGGRVEELSASGLLAAFGLELVEDAPRRAANAATAMRTLAARARSVEPRLPDVKLAVHTEHVPVARAGDAVQIDGDARRSAAATLEALLARAGAGEIVVSASAAGFLARTFALDRLIAPEGACRLTGHADPARTRFVGRERELSLLLERFEMARAGQGQVVVIFGEPGIGKSRLLGELHRRLGARVAWVEGQAVPFGRSMPFRPIIDMLRRAYRVEDVDPDATVAAKLERGVLRLGEDLRSTLPYLRDLLSVDPVDTAVARMDPKLRHAEIVMATHRLLERASERWPHVIVIEDAHWMDPATEGWVRLLADRVAARPVVFVLTCRPGYAPPFDDRTYHTRLALPALASDESARIAEALLGVDDLPLELRELVGKKAEGNPFFVEELVKSLREVGAVRRDGDRLVVARALEEVDVPDTVQDVLLARIGRLGDGARGVLQLASVIGREFGRRLLDRLAPASLEFSLGELKSVELVHEKTLFPEQVFTFKHGLIRRVAYETLSPAKRRELHRLVGSAIAELHAERLPEQYGLLAYHFSRAEEWPRALDYLLKAADKAAASSAIQEAIALYAEAQEAAGRQPDGADTREAIMRVHLARAALHLVTSDFRQSRDEAHRLLELARHAGDRAREATALGAIARAQMWTRELDAAVRHAREAIELAEPLHAGPVLAGSHYTIGFVRAVTGRLDEGEAHLGRAIAISRSAGDHVHHSLALAATGLMKNWEGEYADAVRLQSEAVDIARQHGLPYPLVHGLFMCGISRISSGQYTEALADYGEGLALAERLGDEALLHRMLNCLGWLHLELGDVDVAEQLNRRSAEIGRRRKDDGTIPNAEINLGDVFLAKGDLPMAQELYEGIERYACEPSTSEWMRYRYSIRLAASQGELWLARGDLERARRYAERCLEEATRTNARKNLVKGWRLAGDIAVARRAWDDAERALQQALVVAEAIGSPPQSWATHAALARLARARGRPDEARRAAARGREVVDGVLAGLRDPELRASLTRAPAVRALNELAGGAG